MKKKIFFLSAFAVMAFAGDSFAQSSSEIDKANPNPLVTAPAGTQTIIDSRVDPAYQFIIGLCEVKDGVYYIDRTKFTALTASQQGYVRNNSTLFVIKD